MVIILSIGDQPYILVTLPTTLMGGFSFGVIDGMVNIHPKYSP